MIVVAGCGSDACAMSIPPPSPVAAPERTLAAHQHRPGLWLATAPVQFAAAAAARYCPEAIALAAQHHTLTARREAFVAGRALAAAALQAMGLVGAVGRGIHGAPAWPPGVSGSISHDAVRAVAAVARSTQWAAVGVDVEPDLPLPADAAAMVLQPADRAALDTAFGARAPAQSRLVFCAKECVHKALHPWRGAWLEFDEVEIVWLDQRTDRPADSGRWQARPVGAAARAALAGVDATGEWWRAEDALWCLLAIRA